MRIFKPAGKVLSLCLITIWLIGCGGGGGGGTDNTNVATEKSCVLGTSTLGNCEI